ncbi:helix-turn-helix domain-containing protein [Mesorhizobium muleiense]
MTIREVAEYLKLTDKTAYRLAADGTLPGCRYRILRRRAETPAP